MMSHEVLQAVDRILRHQHGAVHRNQALEVGMTRSAINARLRSKAWLRLAPSVLASAAFPSTWKRQYKAAELATPGSKVAGLSAAHLLGWDGFRTRRPEVVSTHTANHRNQLAVVHRAVDVKSTVVDGIAVTTHAQTLCDLLTRISLDRWEQTCDRLLLTRQMTIADLDERVAAYANAHRKAIGLLRELVLERSGDAWIAPESELETLLRSAVALVPNCPEVLWQVPAPWDDNERVDGFIPAWRLILEGDGRAWHARVADFERDRWRDARAAACGLRVQRYTYTRLKHCRDEVAELIAQAGNATIVAA